MTADPREILARWAPGPDFTVRYGDHPEHVVDVRLPAGDPTGPLVIFIHGGFWMAEFDRAHTAPLAVDLAARGYPVATIEFRRIGQDGGGWPGTFTDVSAAVARTPGLIAEALAAQGCRVPDLDRPVLAGHSAGGQLALWYASRPATPVRGVLALAPVADLALGHRLGLGDGAVAALLGGGPDEVPDRYEACDPMRLLPAGVPAVLVFGTEDDRVPVEVGRSYVNGARMAGDHPALIELPDTEHFAVIDPRSAVWSTVLGALHRLSVERDVDDD
ncbi:alpha/beta hydrolase [Planosporangium flavigriseum]|uniref:Lipase n=1 Tax=Planosporangium flavigriseum TaxID=373681 RepID=A0A8J3LVI3_9ACTN|nr:alpha/beta hydrolase [Planosporangium flavigriseum]NJC64607.1 alpha/beta hydrolase [Planosporangium flavigriseum]GIG71910.1 lipase [Planosporangium flavigriseum]